MHVFQMKCATIRDPKYIQKQLFHLFEMNNISNTKIKNAFTSTAFAYGIYRKQTQKMTSRALSKLKCVPTGLSFL